MEKPFRHFWQLSHGVSMLPEVTELPMDLITSFCVIFLLTQWYERDKIPGELFFAACVHFYNIIAYDISCFTNSEGEG